MMCFFILRVHHDGPGDATTRAMMRPGAIGKLAWSHHAGLGLGLGLSAGKGEAEMAPKRVLSLEPARHPYVL